MKAARLKPPSKVAFPYEREPWALLCRIAGAKDRFRLRVTRRDGTPFDTHYLLARQIQLGRLKGWAERGFAIGLAPDEPVGLLCLQGVTKRGVAALEAADLAPAAICETGRMPWMDGTMDAWIRLGDFSSRSDASPLEADDPAYGFSLACRLVAGIAGLEPRFVRWDEGGFIPGFIHPHSGRRVHLKNADDTAPAGIAPGGARILAEARDRKQRIEALRMEAISLGYDFIADAEAPARRQTHRSAEVIYKRHAAMARGLGGASTGVIDMSVVRACARVGVSIERARNILYWSPEVKSIREAARSRNPPAADGGEREARVYVADLINLAYLHPDSRTHGDATMRRWQSIRAEISEVVMGHEASQAVLKLFR